MSKRQRKAVFKPYNSDQLSLLPPSLDELIPENHVVRVVRDVIDKIKIDSLLKKYKGGGAGSFHPKMMLKIVIYGYLSNIYSSRKIEQAVCSNIQFMWLAGMQRPDHNTINRFRSDKLKGVLKEVFAQVVTLMAEQGLMDIKIIYVDGTKLEANANKYTFVWGKSIKRHKKNIKTQLEELWKYAESVTTEEMMDNDPTTYPELDAAQVSKTIDSINEALKDKLIDKKVKQKLKYAKDTWPKNMAKYKKQEELLGDRNSYSKTDTDATFMRMKDDHLKNGQLKAGYNWQISTSNQYIINYDIYHNPTDTLTLPHHLEQYQQMYNDSPSIAVADAGYGSEENYTVMEDKQIEAYVKYNNFHRDHIKGKLKPREIFQSHYLYYNKQEDYLVCPMGQRMKKVGEIKRITKSGYEQKVSAYESINCQGCPLIGTCHGRQKEGNPKSKKTRITSINHNMIRLRDKAKEKLLSEQGVFHRSQRPVDVEAVFGNIKQNKKFTRFNLRGQDNVLIEAGLVALAHNLAKMARN